MECTFLAGDRNEETHAVAIAGLERDVHQLFKEIENLRADMREGFGRREKSVDKELAGLEERINVQLNIIKGRFDDFTPLEAFKPVRRWSWIIASSMVALIGSSIVAMWTFVIEFFRNGAGPPNGTG